MTMGIDIAGVVLLKKNNTTTEKLVQNGECFMHTNKQQKYASS